MVFLPVSRYHLSMNPQPHGGNVSAFYRERGFFPLDFSASVNPDGAHCAYPDPNCTELREAIAGFWRQRGADFCAGQVLCGAGASDVLHRTAAFLRPDRALFAAPCFGEYRKSLAAHSPSCKILEHLVPVEPRVGDWQALRQKIRAEAEDCASDGRKFCAYLCSPSNPAGSVVPEQVILEIASICSSANSTLILDSCFCDFDQESLRSAAALAGKNGVVVIHAFTKAHGLAGLRAGYGIFSSEEEASAAGDCGPSWAVSAPAQQAALASLNDCRFVQEYADSVAKNRIVLAQNLRSLGLEVFCGKNCGRANFLLAKVPAELAGLDARLEERGILVRSCANFFGLDASYIRIAVRGERENQILCGQIDKIRQEVGKSAGMASSGAIKRNRPDFLIRPAARRRAASIMVQGTMSGVGKSLVAAALCRIFWQDGLAAAPFKSQNMSLNSAVTADGREIGRAQAMQAQFCGLEPDVRMNPILLKPESEGKSQVIVDGLPLCVESAAAYFRRKKSLVPRVMAAFGSLAAENDVIVIEGAGSPAEINLRENDIVNMGLAAMTDSPVLLVGDIDRGGVFAQLCGTMSLLLPHERERVAGLVINKFRGDKSLLMPGVKQLERMAGRPVLGVLPYVAHSLPDEDSLSQRLSASPLRQGLPVAAAVRLPRISNFTDLDPLRELSGMNLAFVSSAEELGRIVRDGFSVKMIIIPGSKSTESDFRWLVAQGFCEFLKEKPDLPVLGVCGGLQMLGMAGFLPVSTEFGEEKVLRKVAGRVPALDGIWKEFSDCPYEGYEIHHGVSEGLLPDFAGLAKGRFFGTYVHGFFDSDEILRAFCRIMGIKGETGFSFRRKIHADFDLVADSVRKNLDMERIYSILNLGGRK